MFSRRTFLPGLLAAACALAAGAAQAVTQGVIPAASRVDVAFDTAHRIAYISGGATVQRYDVAQGRFLEPLNLGGYTMGMDISADGRTLAVANAETVSGVSRVDLVDLETLATRTLNFQVDYYEAGTYAVAFDKKGQLLVSASYNGSGWVPLRKVDPATGLTSQIGSVRQDSMLSPSATHKHIAVTESNISSGPYGRYTTGDTRYGSAYSTGWFTFEIAIAPNGGQMAVPTYGGTFVWDATKTLPQVGEYAGVQPIGVAYSPDGSKLYAPLAYTSQIGVYKRSSMAEIKRLTVPAQFGWVGNHAFGEGRIKISADGTVLLCTVPGGVYFRQF